MSDAQAAKTENIHDLSEKRIQSNDAIKRVGIDITQFTSASKKIHGEFIFNVSPEKLWPYMYDAKGIASWFPIILGGSHDGSTGENNDECSVGAKRYCKTLGMGTLDETILYVDKPIGYVFNVKNIFLPVKNHAAAMALEEISPGKTKFTWSIHFDYKGLVMRHIMPPVMAMFMTMGLNGLVKKLGGQKGKMRLLK